jgi:hypothetical protein
LLSAYAVSKRFLVLALKWPELSRGSDIRMVESRPDRIKAIALPRHRQTAWAIALVLFLPAATAAQINERFGPQGLAPARNFQPIQGLSLQMSGESAIPLKKGDITFRVHEAETSTVLKDVRPGVAASLKLNQLHSDLEIRYGLSQAAELGVELTSLYNHSGALDGLINTIELIGAGKLAGARQQLKNSGFVFVVTRDGRSVLEGKNGEAGLADLVLRSKIQLVTESRWLPAIAFRPAVKIPLGDSSRAFSTGHVDFGVGLAAQKTFKGRLVVYLNLNEVFPTGHYLGYDLKPYFIGVGGVEIRFTPRFSVMSHLTHAQSPYHGTGTDILDQGITEITVALGYRFTPNLLGQIYGVENLLQGSAADFTLALAVTYRLSLRHDS